MLRRPSPRTTREREQHHVTWATLTSQGPAAVRSTESCQVAHPANRPCRSTTAVCTLAATIGGVMPLAARAIKVDPAVFSNPFITTFVDASGLIIYFLIARAVLGI